VVDTGDLLADTSAVELRHAAGDDQRLPRPLVACEGVDGVDGLLLALLDEAAGVDDDRIRVARLDHRQKLAAHEQPLEVLAVDVVLGAAEGDEMVRLGGAHCGPALTASVTDEPGGRGLSGAGLWSVTVFFAAVLWLAAISRITMFCAAAWMAARAWATGMPTTLASCPSRRRAASGAGGAAWWEETA